MSRYGTSNFFEPCPTHPPRCPAQNFFCEFLYDDLGHRNSSQILNEISAVCNYFGTTIVHFSFAFSVFLISKHLKSKWKTINISLWQHFCKIFEKYFVCQYFPLSVILWELPPNGPKGTEKNFWACPVWDFEILGRTHPPTPDVP